MQINRGKTKVLATDESRLVINVEETKLEQVDKFTYLGVVITDNGNGETDIKIRIGLAKTVLSKLTTT